MARPGAYNNTTVVYKSLREEKRCCGGLCCGQGLTIGILVCIYFVLVLPLGLFLAMVGGQKRPPLIGIGLAVIFGPLIFFVIACFVETKRRRNRNQFETRLRMNSIEEGSTPPSSPS
ncbi:uncharacterized protein LOC117122072 isoform X2 [Anneissia japonica]|uniref:uncharacterized protein LOC117122072 isoform X2 n=1 Tax=Anneissia japonica TaxID=1529436 RepID=UPI0014256F96|nr:uncharacterized protein LOC117122072 isoform X2 [Anneissia japonica]